MDTKMIPKKEKVFDLSIVILEFCSEKPRKYGEILDLDKNYDVSRETIKRRIAKLKRYGYLTQNPETKKYSTYGNVEVEGKNLIEQIELQKIEERIINGTWSRINELTKGKMFFEYSFSSIQDKIVFSDSTMAKLNKYLWNILEDIILLNPELFSIINKPEHLNFKIGFRSELGNDPEIFNLYKKLRKKIKIDKPIEDLYNKAFTEHYIRKKNIK